MAFDSNKISNILGSKIPQWLINQLDTRSVQGAKDVRDNDNVLFIANKTAWIRLVSSIDIINPPDIEYFRRVIGDSIKNKDDLAKQFVLFGGTSKYLRENSYQQRAGLGKDGAYGILGTDEIQQFGYKPMPGITSVTIDTQGKLGSLRAATINFKCWDKAQLDIIDALYFKLGFTMFLEWGQTFFYPQGSNRIQSTELYSIDPFRQNLTKEEIAIQISRNIRQSEGNYDALLGMVTNFNFTYNQDGGYDCTIKLMALGILGDAIKINNPKDLPNILAEEIRRYNNTLIEISNAQQLQDEINRKKAEEEAAQRERESQISILRTLNLNINQKDAEPTFSELGRITQAAGYPGSSTVNVNDFDYLRDIKGTRGWSLFLPTFGASIPTETTNELVSSVTLNNSLFFDKISVSLNFKPNQQTLSAQSIPGTTIPSVQSQTQRAIQQKNYLEYIMFFNSTVADRGNQYKLNISYIGANTKLYYGSIIVEFATSNPQLKSEILNKQAVYEAAIKELRNKSNYEFTSIVFQTRPVVENFATTPKPFGTVDQNINQAGGRYAVLGLSTEITVEVPGTVLQTEVGVTQTSTVRKQGDVQVPVKIDIITTDPDLISNITKGNLSPNYLRVQETISAQNQNQAPTKEDQAAAQEANNTQIQQSLQLQSGLELALRTIQVHALNKAINQTKTPDLEIGRKVYKLPIWDERDKTQGGVPFYTQIFSNGIFSKYITELINGSITDIDPKNPEDRFKIQSKYGFATELMSGRVTQQDIKGKEVDFKELLSAFVVPYQVNQEIVKGINTNHPVYIPLGLLLMILNHNCTIYDTKDSATQTPLVYIDFNPKLNFFLTNTKHLSTNPFKVLIPFEGSFSDYQELFSQDVLTTNKVNILPLSGSTSNTPLFNTANQDALSSQIPSIKFGESNDGIYRGRMMNVLLNIDYVIQLVRDYSLKDGTNSIYLKTFLEQIVLDVNKYLGNFSILRLAYNDGGNTFHIVDDQVIPTLPEEIMLEPDNISEIPLVGKNSIAKSLEIKTDVSTKLSNMIAISANSDVEGKSTLSTNGDSFGFVNTSYKDRFIPIKGDVTGSVKSNQDTVKAAAIQFNQTISDFYSKINPSEANVSQATNYYIERMSKVKNNEYPTRASAMIPVSVNFTTDGVSGFTMGQAFTISDQILPYTYNNRIVNQKGLSKEQVNKVGFVVVGLTNTIENNQWNTAVRANMIFLKYKSDFVGSIKRPITTSAQFGVNVANENVSTPTQNTNFVGSNSQAKKVAEDYLGKQMTDQEWNQLVAATFAEASRNQQEEAWVMAVILNRTRTRYLGAATILDTLTRKNQFQAVTGTSANGNRPSANYVNGPTTNQANSIYGAIINILPTVPKNYLFFTSNNVAAYGKGTSLAFLDNLKKQPGSKIIGQTVFSTTA
jgi:hypothetical protein